MPNKIRARTRTPDRDSEGRFAADHHTRNLAIGGILAGLGAVAIGAAAYFRESLAARLLPAGEGHAAPDLAADQPAPGTTGERAPPAFRPDIDAPMTAAEREALRPATGPAPTLVPDEGAITAS